MRYTTKSWWTHNPNPMTSPMAEQAFLPLRSALCPVSRQQRAAVPSSMIRMYSALASRLQNTSAGGAKISSSDADTATHRVAVLSSSMKLSATYIAKMASVTLLSAITLGPNSANAPADA